MTTLEKKIDFAVIFEVHKANPNGDPLNGNHPRQDFNGFGEVSDVAIKRKLRNRLQDEGESILVQSDERRSDAFRSIRDRVASVEELNKILTKGKGTSEEELSAEKLVCEHWYDVRTFGQVFAFKNDKISLGIRGPVSIHTATSVDPIDITSMQITKSVNSVTNQKNPNEKTSDTMGMKHRVDFGVYVFYGSINPQLAERTGFTYEDAQKLKEALRTLFVNDASSARPEGSMEVHKLFWWEHNSKLGQYSSARVHRTVNIERTKNAAKPSIADYKITVKQLENLDVEEYDGL